MSIDRKATVSHQRSAFSFIWLCLCVISSAVSVATPAGLLAEWNFDEGRGDIAHDASGNGHDAKVSGAAWVKQGDGFAVYLDGFDDYADCGSLGIAGPVSFETWVKPMRKGYGEACLIGESLSSYLLTYYNTEVACWYIGSGGNSFQGKLNLGEWNHIVATFDGKLIALWVNGRLIGSRESKFTTYQTEGGVIIGTKGQPSLARFKGMVDKVRVYNRALSAEESVAHFKAEAAGYGFDPTWFSRVKATLHSYWDRGEIVVEADYRGLQPLDGRGRLEVTLSNKEKPKEIIQQRVIDPASEIGVAETTLSSRELATGSYVIHVSLQDGKGARPTEELAFSYPPKPASIPAPASQAAAAMPSESKPTPFGIKVNAGGGFTLTIKGTNYPFECRISWPRGDFNRLAATDAPYDKGEKSWKVSVQSPGKDRYQVDAAGDSYTIRREIEVFPTHVQVKDTYTNTSKDDLGLLIYNEMTLKPAQVTASWLSGHEGCGRRAELSFPDYGPNVFLTDANTGMGIIPIDDVYVVQATPYVLEEAAGLSTEKFALAPGQSYTLEWAVYPTGSGDYYDYINAFRKVEGRTSTVAGAPGFITYGPNNRRQVPEQDFLDKRAIKIGIIHCLSNSADDPELSIEGIEFTDFPKEMQLLKGQTAAIHRQHPGLKAVFHIAHSLYCTDKPDRFADSKAIGEDGKQTTWGDGSDFGKAHQAKGWRWWIFYPTPGNSFHNALLKSVDVLMDDLGFDGVFMDGFLAGYISQWTYDGRWDGHSADIDPSTKTIKRKIGSVVLLSQPSMIEFARKIRGKGGIVIANNTVFTRSIAKEQYIIFDNECASGPEMHLAPSATVLANPPFKTEKDIYLDMLDKLSWGELFLYYNERLHLTYASLAAREFPMTFEEIRSGLVRGKERIVTMNPGVYGWPGERDLHAVYKFDDRGAPVPNEFITTVDSSGVRTELKFGKQESAVIERIPASIESGTPVNARVLEYGGSTVRLLLNGQGDVVLTMFVGTFYPDRRINSVFKDGGVNPASVGVGTDYRVTVGGATSTIKEKDGTLVVPLKLNGQTEIVIAPADGKGR